MGKVNGKSQRAIEKTIAARMPLSILLDISTIDTTISYHSGTAVQYEYYTNNRALEARNWGRYNTILGSRSLEASIAVEMTRAETGDRRTAKYTPLPPTNQPTNNHSSHASIWVLYFILFL